MWNKFESISSNPVLALDAVEGEAPRLFSEYSSQKPEKYHNSKRFEILNVFVLAVQDLESVLEKIMK